FAARRPSRCAHLVQAQQPAGLAPRPAATGSVVHQVEQSGLDGCVYASWDRAGSQSQCVFPSYKCKAITCSATMVCSLASCSRVSSSSTCSGVLPARHGLADSAARAPSLAVRQIEVIVVRSTRHRAAASRWVYWPVNTEVNTSYFCDGANRRRFLLPFPTLLFDDIPILQTGKTPPPGWVKKIQNLSLTQTHYSCSVSVALASAK